LNRVAPAGRHADDIRNVIKHFVRDIRAVCVPLGAPRAPQTKRPGELPGLSCCSSCRLAVALLS
jgi:hypothetical protein